jgi:hypothetical protein
MTSVSNGKLCDGVNKNVAYAFTVIFSTCEKTTMKFKLPTDFGKGGAVYIDSEYVIGSNNDIW